MMTFEVQTQRSRHHWITQSHWDNSADALREANSLVGTCKFKGVKVIKSLLEADNMFRETTIFRHGQKDLDLRRYASREPEPAQPAPEPWLSDRRTGIIALIVCIGIVTHAVIGVLMTSGPAPVRSGAAYQLPAIEIPAEAGRMVEIHPTLHFDADDPRIIDRALPSIVDQLNAKLGAQGARALRRR